MFWFSERTLALGSCASICTWQSALGWLCQLQGKEPTFTKKEPFKIFKHSLVKEYGEEADTRLPFELKHIIKYTIHNKCYGRHLMTIDLDILLNTLMIQLYTCLMTRSSELARQKSDIFKTGLRYKDFEIHNTDSNVNNHYFKLFIHYFKNRKTKNSIKSVWLGNANCPHKYIPNTIQICPCNYVNPYLLFTWFLHRTKSISIYNKSPKANVFMFKNGNIFSTTNLNKLAKQIAIVNHLPQIHRYTGYSFRITGTTLSTINNIPQPKLLRFVGWKPSHMPNVCMRYMRYNDLQLSAFIFELLHGHKRDQTNIRQPTSLDFNGIIFDPWLSKIDPSSWKKR